MRFGEKQTNLRFLPEERAIIITAAAVYQLKWTTYIRRVAIAHAEQTILLHSHKSKPIERIEIIEENENG
jgi:uncharacterized protein (DUF1778 family)